MQINIRLILSHQIGINFHKSKNYQLTSQGKPFNLKTAHFSHIFNF